MTTVLAAGILFGILFGVTYGYVVWGSKANDLQYDLWNAEDELRQHQANADYTLFWYSEAQRLRRQHAGTPYIADEGPGVRDGMFSSAWLDDEKDAA